MRWSQDSIWYSFYLKYPQYILALWNKNVSAVVEFTYKELKSNDFNIQDFYNYKITKDELKSVKKIIDNFIYSVEHHEI